MAKIIFHFLLIFAMIGGIAMLYLVMGLIYIELTTKEPSSHLSFSLTAHDFFCLHRTIKIKTHRHNIKA